MLAIVLCGVNPLPFHAQQVLHDHQAPKPWIPPRSGGEGVVTQLFRYLGGFARAATGGHCHPRETRFGGHEVVAGGEQCSHEKGAAGY